MKLRKILIILLAILIAIVPSAVNASDTYTATTTDNLGNSFDWIYKLNDLNQIEELQCNNVGEINGNITIPSEINGNKVISLGDSAFKGAKNITGVTIPDSVKGIGVWAFKDCTSLTDVDLGSVERIAAYAFNGCTELKEIVIPATIKDGASGNIFEKTLTKITLSEGMTIVPQYLCARSGITEITIPDSVKEIGLWAFKDCTSLTDVDLGSVERIAAYAFNGCTELKEIVIPATIKDGASGNIFEKTLTKITLSEGMTIVPQYLCARSGITEITIPNSVKEIGLWAFNNCAELKKITILDNVTKMALPDENKIFENHNDDLTIYCYKDSVAAKYAIDNNIKYVYLNRQSSDNENENANGTNNENTDISNVTGSDGTTTNKILPKAGKSIAVFGIMALIIVLGVAGAAKYFKYKDVK